MKLEMLVKRDAELVYASTPWKIELHELPVSTKQSRSQPKISETTVLPTQSCWFIYSVATRQNSTRLLKHSVTISKNTVLILLASSWSFSI